MGLRSLQKSWDRLGTSDPFWAILTDPRKRNHGWDRAEFFQTGVSEIDHILAWVESVHPLPARESALDFGCGVGRLSQALADRFALVRGVDISPSMLNLARSINRHGDRCQYFLNSGNDLSLFPDSTFDFIYSSITLQHIPPRFTQHYLEEFARVLRSGGVLVFQLPAHMRGDLPQSFRKLAFKAYYDVFLPLFRPGQAVIEMHGIEKQEVQGILQKAGLRILEVVPDQSAGPAWESYRYLASK